MRTLKKTIVSVPPAKPFRLGMFPENSLSGDPPAWALALGGLQAPQAALMLNPISPEVNIPVHIYISFHTVAPARSH